MHFPVAFLTKPLYLRDYLRSLTAALAPARVRHNAVSTELVAAFYDRNKSYIRRMPLYCRDVPGLIRVPLSQIQGSTLTVQSTLYKLWQPVCSARAYHYIHRSMVKDACALQLRNAA